jgi:hypothetical protein
MYMTYTTTTNYIHRIGNCGVVVKQGLRWEGMGMSDIVGDHQNGQYFWCYRETPTVCGAKMHLSHCHCERIEVLHDKFPLLMHYSYRD